MHHGVRHHVAVGRHGDASFLVARKRSSRPGRARSADRTGGRRCRRRQMDAGIEVANDGEMSKPSYATYIKDRPAGFGGTSQPLQYQDLVDFPEMGRRVFNDPRRSRRKTPACNGPIALRDAAAVQADTAHLKPAIDPASPPKGSSPPPRPASSRCSSTMATTPTAPVARGW